MGIIPPGATTVFRIFSDGKLSSIEFHFLFYTDIQYIYLGNYFSYGTKLSQLTLMFLIYFFIAQSTKAGLAG